MAERAPTARLFVALDLPDAVVDAVVAWRTPVLTGRDELRAVPVESLHVTLAFLGSLPEAEIPALSTAVARAVGEGDADGGALALGDPLWLPRRRPRVLTVGVVDGKGGLGRLQAHVAGALAAGGWFEQEARPYLPHVTLARVRGREPLRLEPGDPRAALPAVPSLAFAGTAVTLYRSLLGRGGARYEPLARAALQ